MVKKILIADDSINDTELAVYALRAAGIHNPVLHARDSNEGLALLRSDSTIGLVLLDLKMPGEDGFDFLKVAKISPAFADIPIVVVLPPFST